MKLFYFHNIFYAINSLHWQYGKGELIDAHLDLVSGKITITAKRTSCKPHTATGNYDGITIRIYGHQKKVTVI